jgi:hypothetical protein
MDFSARTLLVHSVTWGVSIGVAPQQPNLSSLFVWGLWSRLRGAP